MTQFAVGELVRVSLSIFNKDFGVGVVGRNFNPLTERSVFFSKFWSFSNEKQHEQYPETIENIELFYSDDRFKEISLFTLLTDDNVLIPYNVVFNVGDYIFPGIGLNRGVALTRISEIRDSVDRVSKNRYNSDIFSRKNRLNLRDDAGKIYLDRNYYFNYNHELDSITIVQPEDIDRDRRLLSTGIWNGIRIAPKYIKDRLAEFADNSEYSVRGYIL